MNGSQGDPWVEVERGTNQSSYSTLKLEMSSVTINSHVFSALVGKVPHAFIPEPLESNEKHDLEGKREL